MRRAFIVYVDLDRLPGDFYSQESAQNIIRKVLRDRLSHYNPTVALAPTEFQPEEEFYGTEIEKDTVTKVYNKDLIGLNENGRSCEKCSKRAHYHEWMSLDRNGFAVDCSFISQG
jgi:hypothetical protein